MNDLQNYKEWQDQYIYDMVDCGDSAPFVHIGIASDALKKMPDGVIATVIGSLILQAIADFKDNPIESALLLANRLTVKDFTLATLDDAMF